MKNRLSNLAMIFALLCIFSLSTVTLHAEPTVSNPATESAQPGWNYENASYHFYYLHQSNVQLFNKTGCIKFTKETQYSTSQRTIIFRPGLYYFNNGQLNLSPNAIDSAPVYQVKADGSLALLGSFKVNKKPVTKESTDSTLTITPNTTYFTGDIGDKVYLDGQLYTGIAKKNNAYYNVTKGTYGKKYSGFLQSTYIDTTLRKVCNPNNKYYKNGVGFTGIYNNQYYKQGKVNAYNGWFKSKKKIYYLKAGTTLTGTHYLKSYGGGSQTYRYTFLSDGTLKTNFFTGSDAATYRSGKLKIEVNITTHTITILGYDTKTNTYDIPLKAFICSTSRKTGATKTGHFNIGKGSRTRWFVPPKSKTHFYQYGTFVRGSYSWFHSEMYRSKNIKNFNANTYNGLGTNQTSACIRLQVVNAKLIFDIAAKHNSVPVHIFRSSAKGAFGQITLDDTTGKIPTSQKYDPTDPAIKK